MIFRLIFDQLRLQITALIALINASRLNLNLGRQKPNYKLQHNKFKLKLTLP